MRLVRVTFCIVTMAASVASAQTDQVFQGAGFQQNHDYFIGLPGEHVNTANGNLLLTFTDLVLPGNAGSELRFQRTYNSGDGRWAFTIAGLPTGALFEAPPVGSGASVRSPYVAMWDGSVHSADWSDPTACTVSGGCDYHLTKEFWLIDSLNNRVYYPDGTIDYFTIVDQQRQMGEFRERRDPFGNTIVLTRNTVANTVTITQTLGAGQTREIELVYTGQAVTAMTYDALI